MSHSQCPPSRRGHSWREVTRTELPSEAVAIAPHLRVCTRCAVLGRVDKQGIVRVATGTMYGTLTLDSLRATRVLHVLCTFIQAETSKNSDTVLHPDHRAYFSMLQGMPLRIVKCSCGVKFTSQDTDTEYAVHVAAVTAAAEPS